MWAPYYILNLFIWFYFSAFCFSDVQKNQKLKEMDVTNSAFISVHQHCKSTLRTCTGENNKTFFSECESVHTHLNARNLMCIRGILKFLHSILRTKKKERKLWNILHAYYQHCKSTFRVCTSALNNLIIDNALLSNNFVYIWYILCHLSLSMRTIEWFSIKI